MKWLETHVGISSVNNLVQMRPGPEVIKLFSSSAQLSMKFQLLINAEIVKNCGNFRFKTQKLVIYPAYCRVVYAPVIAGT